MSDVIEKAIVYSRIMAEAVKVEVEEADYLTWSGPDPRGDNVRQINLNHASKLRKLAKEFEPKG